MKKFSEHLNEAMNYNAVLAFIKKAHSGQKYGDKPYWTHPVDVAKAGKEKFGAKFTHDAVSAALLHDVVEDTKYTLEDLRVMGFSEAVVEAVALLTKDKGLSYAENINRIVSSGSTLAMMVKYADNYVNYTGDKSSWDAKRAAKSQAKYKKSMETIGKKLGLKETP